MNVLNMSVNMVGFKLKKPLFLKWLLYVSIFLVQISLVNAKKSSSVHFGPTGFSGDVKGKKIVVKEVVKGTPADGKLTKGTVIVGLGKKGFANPINDIAAAIDVAEGNAAGGKLLLSLTGGKTVTLQLNKLGDYGPTAPFKSPKVETIIRSTAEQLVKSPEGRLGVELLALMATGEQKYINLVKKHIKDGEWMKMTGKRLKIQHYCTWSWSYKLIMLSEYYLLTKDKSVIPAIKSYAVSLAWGQDSKGMYGHKMSDPNNNYMLSGYGAMNQTTLSSFLGMLMAKKCGIVDTQLDKALKVTEAYVKQYAWKGSFPYSGSGPYGGAFNNNGMSGLAAICMELVGDHEATKFFAQCAATTYDQLAQGHASAYFNPLWTSLGASRTGPWVTMKYFKKIMYYHNLRRRHNGSWAPDWKPGTHDAIALLTYCIGRKKLIVTGREMNESIWVKKEDADDVLELSKQDMSKKSAAELLKIANGHPMPQLRRKASGALGAHRAEMTAQYVKWFENGTPEQKMTAVSQYGWWIKPDVKLPHLEAIGKILVNSKEPVQLRKFAAQSVAYMGEPALKYYMDILRLVDYTNDMSMGKSLVALCPHPFKEKLVTDKKLLYRVAIRLIEDRDQKMRGAGFRMLLGMPLEDFHLFEGKVESVCKGNNPTWTSYSNPGHDVTPAVALLASLNIKEGVDLALKVYDSRPIGKNSFRLHATWAALLTYKGNAKQALVKYHERFGKDKNYGRKHKFYLNMVKAIQDDKSPPKLISMAEAIAAGK